MTRRLGWYLLLVALSVGLGSWFGWQTMSQICAELDDSGVGYTDCDLHPVYAFVGALEALGVALVVIVLVEVGIRWWPAGD